MTAFLTAVAIVCASGAFTAVLLSLRAPAPRPGRPDLAGVWDSAASRDEDARTEAPDRLATGADPGGTGRTGAGGRSLAAAGDLLPPLT